MSKPQADRPGLAAIISTDRRIAAELRGLLARELPQWESTVVDTYPASRAHMDIARLPASDLCFLDVTSDQSAAFEVMSLAARCCASVPVIAVLRANDPDLILHCLRRGAAEFLIDPFAAEQLHVVMRKLPRSRVGGAAKGHKRGRVLAVMPAKGACGATTVACNLAYALKRAHQGKLLLADLDGLTGIVPFLLKVKSQYSFVDALQAGELDAELWKALVTPAHGIDVLLSPENPVDSIGESWDPGLLLDFARQAYSTVLLDSGGSYGEWNLALAHGADEVMLVTTNELPALHAAQRAVAYLEHNGVHRSKILLAVNRYHDIIGLQRQDIETALRLEVHSTLPSDADAIHRSLLDGKPVPSSSKFGKSIVELAERLVGRQPAGEKAGRWGGLLGRMLG
jgi:pilus assembly protein CpaE